MVKAIWKMTEKCFHALRLASHLPVSQMTLPSGKMSIISTQLKNTDSNEKCMLESHNIQ